MSICRSGCFYIEKSVDSHHRWCALAWQGCVRCATDLFGGEGYNCMRGDEREINYVMLLRNTLPLLYLIRCSVAPWYNSKSLLLFLTYFPLLNYIQSQLIFPHYFPKIPSTKFWHSDLYHPSVLPTEMLNREQNQFWVEWRVEQTDGRGRAGTLIRMWTGDRSCPGGNERSLRVSPQTCPDRPRRCGWSHHHRP